MWFSNHQTVEQREGLPEGCEIIRAIPSVHNIADNLL
jgi:hypothetical protein